MAFYIYLTWSLNFEWILTFLHFYSPHPKITFCFIIFYNLLLGCRTESVVIWLQNPRVSWVLHWLDGGQNQVLGWAIAASSISPGTSTRIWWVWLTPGERTEETEVSQSWFWPTSRWGQDSHPRGNARSLAGRAVSHHLPVLMSTGCWVG